MEDNKLARDLAELRYVLHGEPNPKHPAPGTTLWVLGPDPFHAPDDGDVGWQPSTGWLAVASSGRWVPAMTSYLRESHARAYVERVLKLVGPLIATKSTSFTVGGFQWILTNSKLVVDAPSIEKATDALLRERNVMRWP